MSALTEAALLREVARVQHDKTLQAVRDLIDGIKVAVYDDRRYEDKARPAKDFRSDLLAGLQRLRDDA